jgi:hypothetical protein
MKLSRFIKKCLTDPPTAWSGTKLLARSIYGECYWTLKPNNPLIHNLQNGGILVLEPGHSFIHSLVNITYEIWQNRYVHLILVPEGKVLSSIGASR